MLVCHTGLRGSRRSPGPFQVLCIPNLAFQESGSSSWWPFRLEGPLGLEVIHEWKGTRGKLCLLPREGNVEPFVLSCAASADWLQSPR